MRIIINSASFCFYIVTLLITTNSWSAQAKQQTPLVRNGELDLEEYSFQDNGPVKLNGEWEFYWKKFYEKKVTGIGKKYIEVPGLWNTFEHNGQVIGSMGYATYRLKVKVGAIEHFAINFINAATSSNIYIDGKLVYSAGIPSTNKESTVPCYRPAIIPFTPTSEQFEIILQVANFHHRKGGLWEPITFGLEQQVLRKFENHVYYEVFFIGSVLVMGIFHLVMFLFHPSERLSLYFALFAISMSFRMAVTGAYTVYMIGNFKWEWLVKTDYLCFYLSILFFLMYLKSLFSSEVNKTLSGLFTALSILFSLSVLLLPPRYFSYGMVYYQGISVLFGIFAYHVVIKARKKKLQGAKFFMYGFIVLFVTMIHDILRVNEVFYAVPLASVGITIFVLFQASFLSFSIRGALIRNNELTEVLQLQNREYAYLNKKYREQNKALNMAKEKAEESDRLKTAFLENMSHEIRTPMNGIMGFLDLMENLQLAPEEQTKYVDVIRESGERMLSTINDIVDASKLNTGQVEIRKKKVLVNDTINTVYDLFKKEAKRREIDFFLDVKLPEEEMEIYTDPVKLKKILCNLVKNSVKYTFEGYVKIMAFVSGNDLQFTIIDTGIGIPEDRKETIFKPFEQVDNETLLIEGIGLGLSISKSYVEMLGGEIWFESTVGKGSIFNFTVPVIDETSMSK